MKKNLFKRAMAMGLSVLMVSGLSGCNGSEGKDFTLEGGDPNDLPQQISMMADTVVLPENGLGDWVIYDTGDSGFFSEEAIGIAALYSYGTWLVIVTGWSLLIGVVVIIEITRGN